MSARSVQYPGRYRLTPVSGMPDVFQVTAEPGIVYSAGPIINKAFFMSVMPTIIEDVSLSPTNAYVCSDFVHLGYKYAIDLHLPNYGIDETVYPRVIVSGLIGSSGRYRVLPIANFCKSSLDCITVYSKANTFKFTRVNIEIYRKSPLS